MTPLKLWYGEVRPPRRFIFLFTGLYAEVMADKIHALGHYYFIREAQRAGFINIIIICFDLSFTLHIFNEAFIYSLRYARPKYLFI